MTKKTGTRTTTKMVAISSLVQDSRNAWKHGERNRAAIRQSLVEHGQIEPLTVQRSTMRILAGNARHQQMAELGWPECLVTLVDCDDVEAQKIAVRMNRTAELHETDAVVLAGILAELDGVDLAYNEDEIARLTAQAEKDSRPVIAMVSREQDGDDDLLGPRVEHDEPEESDDDSEEPPEEQAEAAKPVERLTESITIPCSRLEKRRWEEFVKRLAKGNPKFRGRQAFLMLLEKEDRRN